MTPAELEPEWGDEEPISERKYESEAKAWLDSQKNRAGFETLYPEDLPRKKRLVGFIARLIGPLPDAYESLAAGVAMEYIESIHQSRDFSWQRAIDHPMVQRMSELSVSLGGGKGRKEGVELGKSQPPIPVRSRWSFGRHQP